MQKEEEKKETNDWKTIVCEKGDVGVIIHENGDVEFFTRTNLVNDETEENFGNNNKILMVILQQLNNLGIMSQPYGTSRFGGVNSSVKSH
jgi:hypothetical protein